MERIDAHQHFWSLHNSFTDWPGADLAAIYRDYGPGDLAPLLEAAGVAGTILVQAAASVDETRYLLDLAARAPFVRGVVGWVDFEARDACAVIAELAGNPLFRGVRPMVQGIETPDWLLREEFAPIYRVLTAMNLRFDALIRRDQIGQICELARQHPDLGIVIDHAAKPNIAGQEFEPWAEDIARAAGFPLVYCKLSGLWTEAGEDCAADRIAPYVSHILGSFGPDRVMWGSDWPVLGLAGSYGDWARQAEDLLCGFSDSDRAEVFGGTARRFYNVD